MIRLLGKELWTHGMGSRILLASCGRPQREHHAVEGLRLGI